MSSIDDQPASSCPISFSGAPTNMTPSSITSITTSPHNARVVGTAFAEGVLHEPRQSLEGVASSSRAMGDQSHLEPFTQPRSRWNPASDSTSAFGNAAERDARDPMMPRLQVIRARPRPRAGSSDDNMPPLLSVSGSSDEGDATLPMSRLTLDAARPNGLRGSDWDGAELERLSMSFNLHSLHSLANPQRARILLNTMTVLPTDTLERYIRVCSLQAKQDNSEDVDCDTPGDGVACSVCWESLLPTQGAGVATWNKAATSEAPPNMNAVGVKGDTTTAARQVVALPCTHVFHSVCLEPWLQHKTTCPQCRFQLDPTRVTRTLSDDTLSTALDQSPIGTLPDRSTAGDSNETISPSDEELGGTTLEMIQSVLRGASQRVGSAEVAPHAPSANEAEPPHIFAFASTQQAVFADLSSFLSPPSTSMAEALFDNLATVTTTTDDAAASDVWAAASVPTGHAGALGELSFSFNDFMEETPDLFPHSFARSESVSPMDGDDEEEEREPEGPAATLAGPALAALDDMIDPMREVAEVPRPVYSQLGYSGGLQATEVPERAQRSAAEVAPSTSDVSSYT
ncbi:hypothetical protein FRB95_007628 [Tulasnella sp. JGI-2019a]|nr:hypothetical protein FRB95_007628 [Tulasnella sp. JGI-2019a]